MSKLPYKIQTVQDELSKLSTLKNFEQTQRVILSVVKLLDDTISENDLNLFQLFNDTDRKIYQNASWFFEDQVIADRKATYKVHAENKLNIDFKVYGVNKASKRVVAWSTALTPNFEDEPFNSKFNLGIDFIVPKSTDRVIVVLTNNYVIRTLELRGDLTATFQEIFGKWLEIKDFSNKTAIHTALWESFDLQPLNKKFYAGISERFITLRQHLIKENILDEKYASMFANRLIGRVIFTWFLDKKGIINPDLKYFDSHSFESDSEYYKAKLERLFFGVLNTPIDEREYKDELTPFLNGGLFEARQNDLYKDSKLSFPKNYFDDLFDFLSGYNFTTDESTSQFQQVAIDPEMLGRIFENLLAEITEETGEQARKAKGAFYTPREIVDYMCKESLKEYLKTKLIEDTYRDQRLYQLIDAPDKDFQDQDHNWRRDWKPYKDAIITALDDLKVLDPACGSGAFPIGMLQLLVRVYERLEPRFDGYKAKLQIIEKNIYGVDIEPMAVEIARLRTWLSIIVDEESDSKKIKPLPNLEFKFVCANSLVDLDKSGSTSFWDDSELENKLQVLRDAYFNTESLNKKKKLRSEYDDLVNKGPNMFGESEKTQQLKTYRPFDNESSACFFDPEFMFGLKSFGIIIGNPPYGAKLSKKQRSWYLSNYKTAFFKVDTYSLFIERAFMFSEDNTIVCYITPYTWLKIDQHKILREMVLSKNLLQILDIPSKIFSSADLDTIVFLIKNAPSENNYKLYKYSNNSINFISTRTLIKGETININSSAEVVNIINKINKFLPSESQDLEYSQGLIPYSKDDLIKKYGEEDGMEIISKRLWNSLEYKEGFSKELRGSDIKKYKIKWTGSYIKYGDWLHAPRQKKFFILPRLVVREITRTGICCAYSEDEYYNTPVGINIISKNNDKLLLKMFCLILNSSLGYVYHTNCHSKANAKTSIPKILVGELKKFPLPDVNKLSNSEKTEIEKLFNEVFTTTSDERNFTKISTNIDDFIMNLYGLIDKEKDIIRNLK